MYREDEKYDIGVLDEETYSLDTKYQEKQRITGYSTFFEVLQNNDYFCELNDNGEKFMSLEADDFFIPQQEFHFSDIQSGNINYLFEEIKITNYEMSDFFQNDDDYSLNIDNLSYEIEGEKKDD